MRERWIKIWRFFIVGLCAIFLFAASSGTRLFNHVLNNRQSLQASLVVDDPLAKLTMADTGSDGEDIGTDEGDKDNKPPDLKTDFEHDLVIWAINPGYKVGDIPETGELIELRNLSGKTIPLTGVSLRYTNGSGNNVELIAFPDDSEMRGEAILLRYSKSPDHEVSDLVYTTSLALSAGPLELWRDGEKIDTVCWTGKTGCEKAFKSAAPTTLVRDTDGVFTHLDEYIPNFNAADSGLFLPAVLGKDDETATNTPVPRCQKLEFTEIYTYYPDDKTEQFIELHNLGDQPVDMSGCQLRYKKKSYNINSVIAADGYYAYYPNGEFALTKNPGTSNTVELIDANGQTVDELIYLHGQKKSTSYAKFYDPSGAETWSYTYARTPNQANIYQEFKSCESGKVINPETGNCVKADTVTDANGACPAGKYRNPLTGRCKKIEAETTKECAEGYERNPETKRCRKIKTANTGADYALVPTTRADKNVFIAAGVIIAIITAGILYIVWQFRREIVRAFRKIRKRIDHIHKNFITRSGGWHRDK